MARRFRGRPEDPFSRLEEIKEVLTGVSLEPGQRHRFDRYLDLLLLWNKTQRLTGYRSAPEIIEHLFADSLLFLSQIAEGHLKVADIGAGAGIPGVPVRIVRPDIELTLIESMRKRVSFLASLKRELDLPDMEVLEGRTEQLVQGSERLTEAFDVVMARAVPGGASLFTTIMRYLKPGGVFVMAGPPSGPATPVAVHGEYRRLDLPALRVSRGFLVITKPEACAQPVR